jgi:MFS family permease
VTTRGDGQGAVPPEPASIWGGRYRRLTVGIVVVLLLVAFESMAVATAMPVVARALGGMAWYAWAFSAFLATSLAGMVVAGPVTDTAGPRGPFYVGLALFSAGLVAGGLAPSMGVLIAARAVQGLGAGLNVVAVYVVVGRAYPDSLRPRVFAAMSSAWVVPSLVGPPVAGLLADHVSWRAVFLLVAPLVLVAGLVMRPGLRGRAPEVSAREVSAPRASRTTWRTVAGACAVACGAAALQYAGQRLGLVGLVSLIGAVALLVPTVPRLLPPGTLRACRGLPTVVAMRGLLAGTFFGAETFVPLMLVEQRGLATALAGLTLTGGALGWAGGSWWQGRPGLVTARWRLVRAGAFAVAAGIGAVGAVLAPAVPVPLAAVAWTIAGAGMGLAVASLSVLLFELSAPAEQGANASALQLSDGLGSVVFIAAAGAIYAGLHGSGAAGRPFAVILAVMAVLTVGAALLARRLAPASPGASAPPVAPDSRSTTSSLAA